MSGLIAEYAREALIAVCLILWALRDAIKARQDGLAARPLKVPADPMLAAVSISWDRDQQERLLQTVERIALALEAIGRSQAFLANEERTEIEEQRDELLNQQALLRGTIDRLMERMQELPSPHERTAPPRRR